MPDKKKSFWVTLPGILTAVAAVISATTGAYIALRPSHDLPREETVFSQQAFEENFEENAEYVITVLFQTRTKKDAEYSSVALAGVGFKASIRPVEEYEMEWVLEFIPKGTVVLLVGGDVPDEKIALIRNSIIPILGAKQIAVWGQVRGPDNSILVVGKRVIHVFL